MSGALCVVSFQSKQDMEKLSLFAGLFVMFNFTQPYLAKSMGDLHQNYCVGYSKSSASHGVVRF